MRALRTQFCEHPAMPKVLPFLLYMAFLVLETVAGKVFSFDTRLVYPCKVVCVALLLVYFWRRYEDLAKFNMRLHEVLWSLLVGIGVFLLWISLDQGWMILGHSAGYDPRNPAG